MLRSETALLQISGYASVSHAHKCFQLTKTAVKHVHSNFCQAELEIEKFNIFAENEFEKITVTRT